MLANTNQLLWLIQEKEKKTKTKQETTSRVGGALTKEMMLHSLSIREH